MNKGTVLIIVDVETRTHCWKVAQCKDAEQTGFAASSVTNDHQFPAQKIPVSIIELLDWGGSLHTCG